MTQSAVTSLSVVILAAGRGTRMQSDLPKVLHTIAGRPMLDHVLDTALSLHPSVCQVVYGHGGSQVQAVFSSRKNVTGVEQKQQLGTGHALAQALPSLPHHGVTVVLYGDVPFISVECLQTLIAASSGSSVALLTDRLDSPTGYGRVVRDADGAIQAIVEEKDATPEQRALKEINTGILVLPNQYLSEWLGRLSNHNAQGEYYLTDVIGMAVADGVSVIGIPVAASWQAMGVNSRRQLAELERLYQRHCAEALLDAGVQLLDPARVDIRGRVRCGRDVLIDVNVVFEGDVVLADGVKIGAHCVLKDAHIGKNTQILPFSHIEGARIGEACSVGPYARLRTGADLAAQVRIGNFVEVKKSWIGESSKINHLSYIGDADIGRYVNIGAGTITCNYDGVNKFRSVIGDRAFIGSGTMLVAPVSIGSYATVGAGSVICREVSADTLAVARARQRDVPGWTRPTAIKQEES